MTHRAPQRAGRVLPVLALAPLLLGVAACGDDANDHALLAQQLTDRLAAERATTTVPASPPATSGTDEPDSPTDAEAPVTSAAPSTPAPVEPTGVVVPVVALDNSFRPASTEAKVGDEVVWENRGRNEHDVLSVEGTLEDGTAWGITVADFQPGAIYSHVFSEPGEYRYYCTIHGSSEVGMVGTIVITE